MVLTSFRIGMPLPLTRYSSRPSATPAGGRVWNVDTLSSRPSMSPRTSDAADPSTTSSGVEYFIGVHLLPLWDVESLAPRLEPALEPQHGVNLAAGLATAVRQRLDGGTEPVRIDPAAPHHLEIDHGQHRRGETAGGAKSRGRVIPLRHATEDPRRDEARERPPHQRTRHAWRAQLLAGDREHEFDERPVGKGIGVDDVGRTIGNVQARTGRVTKHHARERPLRTANASRYLGAWDIAEHRLQGRRKKTGAGVGRHVSIRSEQFQGELNERLAGRATPRAQVGERLDHRAARQIVEHRDAVVGLAAHDRVAEPAGQHDASAGRLDAAHHLEPDTVQRMRRDPRALRIARPLTLLDADNLARDADLAFDFRDEAPFVTLGRLQRGV